MRFYVNKEDATKGKRNERETCPMARVLRRKLNAKVIVEANYVIVYKKNNRTVYKRVDIPTKLCKIIRDYDINGKPFPVGHYTISGL